MTKTYRFTDEQAQRILDIITQAPFKQVADLVALIVEQSKLHALVAEQKNEMPQMRQVE